MKKKSIEKSVTIAGVGLHLGQKVEITLMPAEPGNGIRFIRSDLDDQVIKADLNTVDTTHWGTTLRSGKASVATVEHLLSAIYALGISDLSIKIDGPEVPIVDGSSTPYCQLLEEAGIVEFSKAQEVFEIKEHYEFIDGESGAEYHIYPAKEFGATVMIDFPNSPISGEYAELLSVKDYKSEIASARTFVLARDLLKLSDAQLIKGGSVDNAVVFADKDYSQEEVDKIARAIGKTSIPTCQSGVFNPGGLRFDNEPARHKILDLMGDISLMGVPLVGRIIVKRPGHASNVRFAKFLKSKYIAWKKLKNKPDYDPDVEPVVDLEGIKSLLPHRYPFLLVDKIIEITDKMVVGVKSISFNEGFFQGHFPGNPVFPGVLQMEALAQTGGILALSSVEDPQNWDAYFLKMDNVKFKNKVVPGDTIILKMELLSPIRRGIVHMQGTTYVGNKIVSEGELVAQIIKRS